MRMRGKYVTYMIDSRVRGEAGCSGQGVRLVREDMTIPKRKK